MDLALNNLQRLIYHKTQEINQPSMYKMNNAPQEFWLFLN